MRKRTAARKIEFLTGYKVCVTFRNGKRKVIDLEQYLTGPIFRAVRKPTTFRKAFITSYGSIEWPNGADICPDVLYYGGPPPWANRLLSQKA